MDTINLNGVLAVIYGIDEVGKSECAGPMVIGVVSFVGKMSNYRDSKKYNNSEIARQASKIRNESYCYDTVTVSAEEIDKERQRGKKLYEIEGERIRGIIDKINIGNKDIVIVDNVRDFNPTDSRIIVEKRADDTYPVVSAASIIAKDKRDRIMDDIEMEFGEISRSCVPNKNMYSHVKRAVENGETISPYIRRTWGLMSQFIDKVNRNEVIKTNGVEIVELYSNSGNVIEIIFENNDVKVMM